jgi:shikimate dehydrogenase
MQFNGHTQLLGLIGDPVSQARTPEMANQILDQRGKLGTYVLAPMHVSSNNLAAFVTGIRSMKNFCGAVVTMPHKTNMALLVDELTPEAQMVKAVNVIRRESDGRLVGTVLDGEGFVGGIQSAGHTITGKTCVLVGAGGAASAIAFSLVKHGCGSLYLLNRTQTKANDLAQRLREAFPGIAVSTALPNDQAFDIAINATSLGMKPEDKLPMEEALIDRTSLVAECVIAPEFTALLEVAKRKGCQVHTGVPMLSAQLSLMLGFMGVL